MAASSLQQESAPSIDQLMAETNKDNLTKSRRRWFQRRRKLSSDSLFAEVTDATLTSSVTSIQTDTLVLDAQGNVVQSCLKKPGSARRTQNKVSFGKVEIHSHDVLLGDNPAVTSGPPLTLEWKSFDDQTLSVDDYENHRTTPRSKMEMLMPRFAREERLHKLGYSRGECTEGVLELLKIKRNREKTQRELRFRETLRRWAKLSTTRVSVGAVGGGSIG